MSNYHNPYKLSLTTYKLQLPEKYKLHFLIKEIQGRPVTTISFHAFKDYRIWSIGEPDKNSDKQNYLITKQS